MRWVALIKQPPEDSLFQQRLELTYKKTKTLLRDANWKWQLGPTPARIESGGGSPGRRTQDSCICAKRGSHFLRWGSPAYAASLKLHGIGHTPYVVTYPDNDCPKAHPGLKMKTASSCTFVIKGSRWVKFPMRWSIEHTVPFAIVSTHYRVGFFIMHKRQ